MVELNVAEKSSSLSDPKTESTIIDRVVMSVTDIIVDATEEDLLLPVLVLLDVLIVATIPIPTVITSVNVAAVDPDTVEVLTDLTMALNVTKPEEVEET